MMKLKNQENLCSKHSILLRFGFSFLLVMIAVFLIPTSVAYAAEIVVNTTADNTDADGNCTLREAITNANNDLNTHSECSYTGFYGDDTIVFELSAPSTITLKPSLADLIIADNLTINGAGASSTIIDRGWTSGITDTLRIFYVNSGTTLSINDITLQNGHAEGASGNDNGGGIYNNGTLTITASIITNSSAGVSLSTDLGYGGGIYNNSGIVNIEQSTISNNVAGHRGGGIANENGGILNAANSTFAGNSSRWGGGVNLIGGSPTANIADSTFTGNTANNRGGGINVYAGAITVTNSTISNNTGQFGAALSNNDLMTLINTTAVSNTTNTSGNGSVYRYGGTLTIINSIIAFEQNANNCLGTITDGGYNLEDANDCSFISSTGSITSTNPMIGPLADNSGPTLTHALQPGSPAIDVITTTLSTCPTTDQRSAPRPSPTGGYCDIGAFEYGQYILSITSDHGTVTRNPDQNTYRFGDVVTMTVTADTGWTFSSWSGPDASELIDNGDDTWSITIDGNKALTANFTINQYDLNVSLDGSGNGSVTGDPTGLIDCPGDCSETLDYGTVITLTATADTGSTFSGWGGACSGTGDCVVTIDLINNVTATFTINQYDLNVSLDGSGSGSVTSDPAGIDCPGDCSETLDFGTTITLTPTGDTGWFFAGWSGDDSGELIDNTDGTWALVMDGDKEITATFEKKEQIIFLPMVSR